MNSPYRAHPALHSKPAPHANTIPFPAGQGRAAPLAAQTSDGFSKLATLVKLEGEIRQQKSMRALAYHAVNDARSLLGFRQAWFFRRNRRNRLVPEAVSDVSTFDVNAPLVVAVTRLVDGIAIGNGMQSVSLATLQQKAQGLFIPLPDGKGGAFAAFLLSRDVAWTDAEQNIAGRLADTYAHAMRALTPPSLLRKPAVPRWALWVVPMLLAVLAFVPVPMTALAPFEVVAHEPAIMSAPIDGVIASVAADPNSPVRAGDLLFTFDDTRQKADVTIAAQKVLVAESRLTTARNGAFNDAELKRSLATMEMELQLAQAEQAYAQTVLLRGEVRAARDGLLLYAARSDWIGKPVRTGEKVMEIADPSHVAFRLDLPVQDSIVLGDNRLVWLFLDADPLHPRAAQIREMSYHAREIPGGGLAYQIMALPADHGAAIRIGLRGTAQVSGAKVPLGFYLLRRPIAALRQYFGR